MDGASHTTSEVFAVNVNWNADNHEWNVNANRLDDNRWNVGNRVLSSNSPVSPAPLLRSGSFRRQSLLPAAEHPSRFAEKFAEVGILLIVERAYFPRKLKEQFQQIEAGDGAFEKSYFPVFRRVACEETVFDRCQKDIVNFRAERVAVLFGEVRQILLPYAVGGFQLRHDCGQLRLRKSWGGYVLRNGTGSAHPYLR